MEPFDPKKSQIPPEQDAAKTWFAALPGSESAQNATLPQPTKKRRGIVIVFIVVVLCAIAILALAILGTQASSVGACLNQDDYRQLTGSQLEETIPGGENFYTYSFDFKPNSSDFAIPPKDVEATIKRLGDFFVERYKQTSIVLTVRGDYFGSEDSTIADERMNKIVELLKQHGIQDAAIETTVPQYTPIEDGEALPSTVVYVSIASDAACSQ